MLGQRYTPLSAGLLCRTRVWCAGLQRSFASHGDLRCSFCKTLLKEFEQICPVSNSVAFSNTFQKCQKLTSSTNPFSLLYNEQPISYNLDLKELKKLYHNRMKLLHPDVNSGNEATEDSAKVTRAFECLRDPISRAVALLKFVYNEEALEESSSIDDPEFIMKAIEANELVEDADDAELPNILRNWSSVYEGYCEELVKYFAINPPDIEAIKTVLQKMNVIRKLQNTIKDRLVVANSFS